VRNASVVRESQVLAGGRKKRTEKKGKEPKLCLLSSLLGGCLPGHRSEKPEVRYSALRIRRGGHEQTKVKIQTWRKRLESRKVASRVWRTGKGRKAYAKNPTKRGLRQVELKPIRSYRPADVETHWVKTEFSQ